MVSKIVFFSKTVKLILTVENDTIVIFLIKKKTKLDYMHYVILKLTIQSIVRRSIILECRTMGWHWESRKFNLSLFIWLFSKVPMQFGNAKYAAKTTWLLIFLCMSHNHKH